MTKKTYGILLCLLFGFLIVPEIALADIDPHQPDWAARLQRIETSSHQGQVNLDHVWTMVAATLVFFMQAGFLLLEAGFVRSKNSINVAQKNIADFILATVLFGAVGFMIMFGHSIGGLGLAGFDWELFAFDNVEDWTFTFFVFQLVFCGTAATIVSGAVAERMKFDGYLLIAAITAVVIYPIFGHWAWGNLLHTDNPAFLGDQGFIDFAGSTVVHSLGAWVALAAVIVIGPRIGRFDQNGNPIEITGHSPVLATMGCLVLWIGWIGFNGGSTTAGTPVFSHIIANTIVSGGIGGLFGMFLGRKMDGHYRPDRAINGVLAGLVGITAGCDAVTMWGAIAIGFTASAVCIAAHEVITHKFKLDDAIGAIPVHGFAGAWGTLAVAFFARPDKLATGERLSQFAIQAEGVILCFIWGFGLS